MAKLFNKKELGTGYIAVSVPSALDRHQPYPLDDSAIWLETDDEKRPVFAALEEYAQSTDKNSYVGQRLTYITAAGDVTHYTIIDEAGTLKMDAKLFYDEESLTLDIYA